MPVESLDADRIHHCGAKCVGHVVPAAALHSAGIVGWRMHAGTIEGPLL